LLHFLALGALTFVVYSWLNRSLLGNTSAEGTVRITSNEVAWLKETWTRQWQREPTVEEMRGLVTDLLREELLAREAQAMGLGENDTIVRRRLAQKLAFLIEDTSRLAEPTEDDLRKFFDAHPERFQNEARVSFRQIYFSRERRADAAADARVLLGQLSRTSAELDTSKLGDRLLIDAEFRDADWQTVVGAFGSDFAEAVFALRSGEWNGPIASGYGLHLVCVSKLTSAKQRDFAEVREQVLERWREQRRLEENDKYFAALLKKYEIVVDDDLKPLLGPLSFAQGGQP
jgi:PPIC-type PPIASE domain